MVKLSTICDDFGIRLCGTSENKEVLKDIGFTIDKGSAYAIKLKDTHCIFYDETQSDWTKKLMVAHELGHILGGHLEENNVLTIEEQEAEARAFAGSMLALMLVSHYKESEKV